ELIAVSHIMKDASRAKEVPHRSGDVFVDRPIHALGHYDCLPVFFVTVQREKKSRALPVPDWSCQRAFVVATLLRRLDLGECVPRIKEGIAKHKIERAMKLGCAALGGDLKPRAARAREQR